MFVGVLFTSRLVGATQLLCSTLCEHPLAVRFKCERPCLYGYFKKCIEYKLLLYHSQAKRMTKKRAIIGFHYGLSLTKEFQAKDLTINPN